MGCSFAVSGRMENISRCFDRGMGRFQTAEKGPSLFTRVSRFTERQNYARPCCPRSKERQGFFVTDSQLLEPILDTSPSPVL